MTQIDFLEQNLVVARENTIRAERAYLAARDAGLNTDLLVELMGDAYRAYRMAERYVKDPSDCPTPFQIPLF